MTKRRETERGSKLNAGAAFETGQEALPYLLLHSCNNDEAPLSQRHTHKALRTRRSETKKLEADRAVSIPVYSQYRDDSTS